jgi:very-short-patch-repair endonuclease
MSKNIMHEHAKLICRDLRRHETRSESILWSEVRNKKFLNEKFLRQHPIFLEDISDTNGFYVADFYCHNHKLIIELDGQGHFYNSEYDKVRTETLTSYGYTILRFRNEEVLENIGLVLNQLRSIIKGLPPNASNSPLGPSLEKRGARV